jgi:hypothetical protein
MVFGRHFEPVGGLVDPSGHMADRRCFVLRDCRHDVGGPVYLVLLHQAQASTSVGPEPAKKGVQLTSEGVQTDGPVDCSDIQVVQEKISRTVMPTSGMFPSTNTLIAVSMVCSIAAAQTSSGDTLPHTVPHGEVAQTIGRVLSWMSTFFYLGSRLPQLYKNHQRRSTAGLSPALFFAAFCGNLFYSTSLLSNPCAWYSFKPYGGHGWAGPEGSDQAVWTALATPFWLGAAGVLLLDAAVGLQFLAFGDELSIEIDRWGRRRRRVTGWMRGWLPSTSPPPTPEGERESLLDVEGRRLSRRASRMSRASRDSRQTTGYGGI